MGRVVVFVAGLGLWLFCASGVFWSFFWGFLGRGGIVCWRCSRRWFWSWIVFRVGRRWVVLVVAWVGFRCLVRWSFVLSALGWRLGCWVDVCWGFGWGLFFWFGCRIRRFVRSVYVLVVASSWSSFSRAAARFFLAIRRFFWRGSWSSLGFRIRWVVRWFRVCCGFVAFVCLVRFVLRSLRYRLSSEGICRFWRRRTRLFGSSLRIRFWFSILRISIVRFVFSGVLGYRCYGCSRFLRLVRSFWCGCFRFGRSWGCSRSRGLRFASGRWRRCLGRRCCLRYRLFLFLFGCICAVGVLALACWNCLGFRWRRRFRSGRRCLLAFGLVLGIFFRWLRLARLGRRIWFVVVVSRCFVVFFRGLCCWVLNYWSWLVGNIRRDVINFGIRGFMVR